jgi:hypothetical protein
LCYPQGGKDERKVAGLFRCAADGIVLVVLHGAVQPARREKTNIGINTFNIGIERIDRARHRWTCRPSQPGVHKVEVSASGLSNAVTVVTLDLKPCVEY